MIQDRLSKKGRPASYFAEASLFSFFFDSCPFGICTKPRTAYGVVHTPLQSCLPDNSLSCCVESHAWLSYYMFNLALKGGGQEGTRRRAYELHHHQGEHGEGGSGGEGDGGEDAVKTLAKMCENEALKRDETEGRRDRRRLTKLRG